MSGTTEVKLGPKQQRTIVNTGPTTVPVYPSGAWSRIPSDVKMEDIWQLVGPQVDKHLRSLPLWKIFCVVYYEGLMHGAGAERSRDKEPS